MLQLVLPGPLMLPRFLIRLICCCCAPTGRQTKRGFVASHRAGPGLDVALNGAAAHARVPALAAAARDGRTLLSFIESGAAQHRKRRGTAAGVLPRLLGLSRCLHGLLLKG